MKKNSLYEKNMQKTTKNFMQLLTDMEQQRKTCFMQKKIGKDKVKDLLEKAWALIKDVNGHATLLRKL